MSQQTWAIILAAGKGLRLGDSTSGIPKQFITWQNRPLFWHSLMTFSRSGVDGAIVVVPEDWKDKIKVEIATLIKNDNPGIPVFITTGGKERSDSVKSGLQQLPDACAKVLVHDAARPFMTAALVRKVLKALNPQGPVVVPGIAVKDTIKLVKDWNKALVAESLPRNRLCAIQTPQGFMKENIIKVYNDQTEYKNITDDAMLCEAAGYEVKIIEGEETNIKITTPQDLKYLEMEKLTWLPCTAMGYDVHRFGDGRQLKLGGLIIPFEKGVIAHSDGDVLLHSLIDALLGLGSLGDIGTHFPDNNPDLEGISSTILLDHTMEIIREKNIRLTHVDLTVVAQKPKLTGWSQLIRKNISRLLMQPEQNISFKATTEEHLGFTGSLEGIKAYSVVTGIKKQN